MIKDFIFLPKSKLMLEHPCEPVLMSINNMDKSRDLSNEVLTEDYNNMVILTYPGTSRYHLK